MRITGNAGAYPEGGSGSMSVRGGLRRFSRLFLDALRFGPQQRRKAPSPGRKMRMEALEPRLLLSADASILVLQAAGADVLRAPDAGTASLDSAERALSPSASAIFFVDSAVKEYASLVDACGAGAEVIILDSAADGIAQVANVLAGRTDVSALHVVSHGVAGRITLGASTLMRRLCTCMRTRCAPGVTRSPATAICCSMAAASRKARLVPPWPISLRF